MNSMRDSLHQDHAVILRLAESLPDARGPDRRRELLAEFVSVFVPQANAKEMCVYGALLKVTKCERSHAIANQGLVEQMLINELLKHLQLNRSSGSELWTAQARVLRQLVRDHCEREDVELVHGLAASFDATLLAEMNRQYSETRERAGVSLWRWPAVARVAKKSVERAAAGVSRVA